MERKLMYLIMIEKSFGITQHYGYYWKELCLYLLVDYVKYQYIQGMILHDYAKVCDNHWLNAL